MILVKFFKFNIKKVYEILKSPIDQQVGVEIIPKNS